MNTSSNRNLRSFAIAMLLAVGIATTIATGGSDSGGIAPPPPPPDNPTLPITTANGDDVASAVVVALGVSFDIGDVTGGPVTPQAVADTPAVVRLIDKSLSGTAEKLENCASAGTVDVTAVLADPNTLTIGDQITAIYDNCDDNEGYVISGEVDLTVTAFQGDPDTGVFLLGFDVLLTDIAITEGAETVTANGDFTLTLDSLGFPVIGLSLAGSELQFGAAGEVITLTAFDHFLEVDAGVVPDTKLAEVLGRLDSQTLGGTVDYETIVPIQAIGDNDPYTGELLITGADNSTVRIVIVDDANVTLEIDANGDGVVDEFVDTTWAALNGETSTINSTTAPAIAREVVTGVTGFGSISVAPGGQFVPTAPFGQLKQQAVSGDFGPVALNCFTNGTATVSGSIGTAGTYSTGDLLAANYTACRHGGEVLDGQMDLTVNSWVEKPTDAFQVTATVIDSGLVRDAGGNAFTGTGTIEASHDQAYTTAGVAYLDASANSFTIGSDNVDRQLSGPTVSAEISIGQAPVTIVRESSGNITSPFLDGSFSYVSIVADTFVFDADPNTGPYSGELLVTASDGSTLRIVAVDDLNVRLEIDLDGDTIVDATMDTTWAAFQ